MNARNRIQRLLLEDDAATATEYAVMLALVLVVILTSVTSLGTSLSSEYTDIDATLFP
jgi:pilus assembly protein Flp/PilA